MKKLGLLGLAATMMMTLAAVQPPAQAKSFGAMINSAVNAYTGRSAYYNQFRYGHGGYGYGYNPYYNGYRRRYEGYRYSPYRYRDWH